MFVVKADKNLYYTIQTAFLVIQHLFLYYRILFFTAPVDLKIDVPDRDTHSPVLPSVTSRPQEILCGVTCYFKHREYTLKTSY